MADPLSALRRAAQGPGAPSLLPVIVPALPASELGGEEMELGADGSPANGSSIALLAEYDG